MLGVDGDLGLAVVILDRQPRNPRRPLHRAALRAHVLPLAQPPLIALAPRRHPALKQVEFLRQLGVEPVGVARLFLIYPLGPRLLSDAPRSEERSVGNHGVRTVMTAWTPYT